MIPRIQAVLVDLLTLAAFQAATATRGLREMLAVLETTLLVLLVKLATRLTGDKCSGTDSNRGPYGLLHRRLFSWFHSLLPYYLLYMFPHPSCLFNFSPYLS